MASPRKTSTGVRPLSAECELSRRNWSFDLMLLVLVALALVMLHLSPGVGVASVLDRRRLLDVEVAHFGVLSAILSLLIVSTSNMLGIGRRTYGVVAIACALIGTGQARMTISPPPGQNELFLGTVLVSFGTCRDLVALYPLIAIQEDARVRRGDVGTKHVQGLACAIAIWAGLLPWI